MTDFLASAYETRGDDQVDPAWKPEGPFAYGAFVVVARFDAESDGRDVVVEECRMPARFYRVAVEPIHEDLGVGAEPGYRITTGSGHAMGALAFQVARAIAEGMLGVEMQPKGGAR